MLQCAALWYNLHQLAELSMAVKSDVGSVRITATLTKEQHRMLRALADKHKVSVAWLVRYAVNDFVEQAGSVQFPLDLSRRS